jgi:hypothetical protein
MIDAGEIKYKIGADVSGLGASLKQAEEAVKGFAGKIKASLDSQAGAFFKAQLSYDGLKTSLKAIGGFLADSVRESMDSARQWALVKQNIDNAGLSYDELKPKIEAVAQASISLGFDDEQTAQSLSKLVLVTNDYQKGLALLTLAQDLSANKGIDLASATKAVTLATQGNTKVLKEYGIEVTDAMSTGEALSLAFDKVKGSAKAVVNPIDVLTQRYANIKQAVGDKLTPTLNDLGKELDANSGALTQMGEVAGNTFAFLLKSAIYISKGVLGAFYSLGAGVDKLIAGLLQGAVLLTEGLHMLGLVSDKTSESVKTLQKNFNDAGDDLINKALDIYKDTSKGIGDVGDSSKATSEELKKLGGASQSSIQGAKDAKKAFEDFQKSLLDTRDKVTELATSLKEKLSDGLKQFKTDLADIVKESRTSLAEIVVKSEGEIKDLQKELSDEQMKAGDQQSFERIKQLQDEIEKKKKIATEASQFDVELAKTVADRVKAVAELTKQASTETDPVKKAMLNSEIDARNVAIEQIKGMGNLDKEIADRRRFAQLDEFQQYQEESLKKIDIKTEEFVQEQKILTQKLELTKQVETEITSFYSEQTALRQQIVDDFAIKTIADLKKIGSETKSAMDALTQLESQKARVLGGSVPTAGKAMGGYTSGGEMVHGGEYVIPRSLVRAMPALISQIEGMRSGGMSKSISAPINVTVNAESGLDVRAVGKELSWEISRM